LYSPLPIFVETCLEDKKSRDGDETDVGPSGVALLVVC
jgi:hypothetical protein